MHMHLHLYLYGTGNSLVNGKITNIGCNHSDFSHARGEDRPEQNHNEGLMHVITIPDYQPPSPEICYEHTRYGKQASKNVKEL